MRPSVPKTSATISRLLHSFAPAIPRKEMGAKRVASSAAATAALVYVMLSGRLSTDSAEKVTMRQRGREDVEGESEERWPERAPASWREATAVAARTVGFAYGETLGKWPIGDIAFGISHYMRLQVIEHPIVSIGWNSR